MIHLDAGFLKVALAGVPSPIVGLKTYPKPGTNLPRNKGPEQK